MTGKKRLLTMKNDKPDRRIKYTKMVLRDSFIGLLKLKPISKITIKEICEKADINRATFYAHYNDQYDLLKQIENELIDDINQYLASYSFSSTSSETLQMLKRIFQYIKENGEVCAVLLSDSGDIDFYKEVMLIVQRQCIDEWTKKSVSKVLAEYIYSFITIGSIGVIQKWLHEGMKKPPNEMAEIITKLTNQGLSAFV
jgi:AcrR family transcriptional regulator